MLVRFLLYYLTILIMVPSQVSAASEDASALFKEGLSLESSLLPFAARSRFAEANLQAQDDIGYHEHYAWFLNEYGFTEDAAAAFSRLATLKKTDAIYRGLGWSQLAIGNHTASIASYRLVFPDLSSTDTELQTLTEIRRRLSEENRAKIANLLSILALTPEDLSSQKELFRNYTYQGMWDDSIRVGKHIRSELPSDLHFQWEYARMLYWGNRLEQADSEFAFMAAAHPDNPFILWEWAKVQRAQNKLSESGINLEKALRLAPDTPEIVRDLAKLSALQQESRKSMLPGIKAPKIDIQTDWYNNSNRYSRLNSGFSFAWSPWSELLTTAGYTFSRFTESSFTPINRQSVFLQAEKKLLPALTITGRLDGNFYDNQQNHLNVRLSTLAAPDPSSVVKLSYDHIDIIDTEPLFGNQLYNPVVSIGAVRLKLTTNDYSVYLRKEFFNEVALWGKLTTGYYSDDNHKLSTVIGMDYSPAILPALKASYSYYYLDFSNKSPESAYFDPANFLVHTAGIAYQKKSARLSYGGELYLHYLQRSNGLGTTVSGFTDLSVSESHKLRCEARYFYQNRGENRDSLSGHFSAEHILLTYVIMF